VVGLVHVKVCCCRVARLWLVRAALGLISRETHHCDGDVADKDTVELGVASFLLVVRCCLVMRSRNMVASSRYR
jgi:hypothetical protein